MPPLFQWPGDCHREEWLNLKNGFKSMLYFSLGDFVMHPGKPEWGIGQVQSIVGMKVTVNFPHAGKQMINCAIVELEKDDRANETPSG